MLRIALTSESYCISVGSSCNCPALPIWWQYSVMNISLPLSERHIYHLLYVNNVQCAVDITCLDELILQRF